MSATKASLDSKGEGRKLRRARNVVRKVEKSPDMKWNAYLVRRYERAKVLLVTAALLKD